jgi:hypothetical protein
MKTSDGEPWQDKPRAHYKLRAPGIRPGWCPSLGARSMEDSPTVAVGATSLGGLGGAPIGPDRTEEALQSFGSLFGSLFREKVAGIERASLNILAPRLPERDRSRFLDVASTERPLGAPQEEERTSYPMPGGTIRLVMLAIDGRGGSILLTDSMCVSRISKSLYISGTDLRREHSRGGAPSHERVIDNGVSRRRQDAFRKWFGLSEQ